MKSIDKVGNIYVESEVTAIHKKHNGAEYLNRLVKWLNARPQDLNVGKSHIDLIVEYNNQHK